MTDIKHIIQKHKTSCGIACVAMVTGKTYKEAILEARSYFRFTTNYLTGYRHRRKLLEINKVILKPLAKTEEKKAMSSDYKAKMKLIGFEEIIKS